MTICRSACVHDTWKKPQHIHLNDSNFNDSNSSKKRTDKMASLWADFSLVISWFSFRSSYWIDNHLGNPFEHLKGFFSQGFQWLWKDFTGLYVRGSLLGLNRGFFFIYFFFYPLFIVFGTGVHSNVGPRNFSGPPRRSRWFFTPTRFASTCKLIFKKIYSNYHYYH